MNYSTLGRTGLKVSRLGFGTAEIGFEYGIGRRPMISEDEACELLRRAVDFGITFFDTARFYQAAEERIGKSGIGRNGNVIIATKCANFLEKRETLTEKEIEKRVREEVEESLRNLRLECLPLLQLHGASAKEVKNGQLPELLRQLKKEGKARFIGVSTRGEESPLAAIEEGVFDVIHVAYSILDQRMTPRVIPEAKKHDIGIINRSVLLKGSLTALREQLPKGLETLKAHADKASVIARSLSIDLPALAIRFAASNPLISTSLIGTNKIENLARAVKAVEAGPLPSDILARLRALAIEDPAQVDPAQWPKL